MLNSSQYFTVSKRGFSGRETKMEKIAQEFEAFSVLFKREFVCITNCFSPIVAPKEESSYKFT